MQGVKVSLIQFDILWKDPTGNCAKLEPLVNLATGDLIVLPEMFCTGFHMFPEKVAEEEPGMALTWMMRMAKEKNAVIAGSVATKSEGRFSNRFYWVPPSGKFKYYDKRHLFTLAGEHKRYQKGEQQVVCELKGLKFGLQVCYDLRFPVWCRRTSSFNYDVLLFVANWPVLRIDAWRHLLPARAIENQSYVIGVNRVGQDGNEVAYNGQSLAIDYAGKLLADLKNKEGLREISIDKESLYNFRKKFPFLKDADRFSGF